MSPALSRGALAALLLVAVGGPAAAQPAKAAPKYALLVGCTEYTGNPRISTLRGPVNDVRLWNDTLTKQFGFPPENVAKLVGWDETDEKTRPTLKNIRAGFEHLIAKAEPGAQIVIALSGHGMRVPLPPSANPLDPDNFEPDGLDEVFLPADVLPADKDGQIPNSLKDDDVGKYLDRLRAKGAHVFIVFDCCHSGTMTRAVPGKDEPRVINRSASPGSAGITEQQVADSIERAKKAVAEEEKRTGKPVTEKPRVAPVPDPKNGSLVAFYAAQPFEEAPEMPLPEDKPIKKEFFHGLLTFSLNTSLQQRQAPLTYGDLAQLMTAQYRAAVGVKGPVPYAEGDLDREVLGYNTWPRSSDIVLTKKKDEITASAGELRGLTRGSVLAVHPPANDARDPKTVLGYVKVTDNTVATASVEPCPFGDQKVAIKPDAIPDLARCTVAARDYGDLRVKLFVRNHPALKAAFDTLAKSDEGREALAMLKLVAKENEADWVLKAVTPKEAADEFGHVTKIDEVLLVRATGRDPSNPDTKAADKVLAATGKPAPRRVYSNYKLADADELAGELGRDLSKVFTWQNLWRVAGDTANARGNGFGVKMEVTRHATPKGAGPGEAVRGTVANGSYLDCVVKNDGDQNMWVVPMYLDSQLEIVTYGKVVAVEAKQSVKLIRGRLNYDPNKLGAEGLVLFLIPQTDGQPKPNFKFLEQSALKVRPLGARSAAAKDAPNTPFGALLKSSVLGVGSRGPEPVTETTPGIVSASWLVVP